MWVWRRRRLARTHISRRGGSLRSLFCIRRILSVALSVSQLRGLGMWGGNMARAMILVIEEEADLRKLFGIILQAEGFDARLAPDWHMAQAVLAASEPDLIIFDWAITDAAGYLWADDLRTTPATAHIPLLFVCGDQPSRSMMQLLGNAGITVIEKPFDIFILRKRVAALLTPLARQAGSNSMIGGA